MRQLLFWASGVYTPCLLLGSKEEVVCSDSSTRVGDGESQASLSYTKFRVAKATQEDPFQNKTRKNASNLAMYS